MKSYSNQDVIHRIPNMDGTVDYYIDDKYLNDIFKKYENVNPELLNAEIYLSSSNKLK